MFLFRAAFWIGTIVIALPLLTGVDEQERIEMEANPVQLQEVAIMLQVTVSDLLGFCDRQPEACETGDRMLWTARGAATNVAGRAHTWLNEGPPAEGD